MHQMVSLYTIQIILTAFPVGSAYFTNPINLDHKEIPRGPHTGFSLPVRFTWPFSSYQFSAENSCYGQRLICRPLPVVWWPTTQPFFFFLRHVGHVNDIHLGAPTVTYVWNVTSSQTSIRLPTWTHKEIPTI